MKTAGIVAEYNPFHNGHAHHLAQTRLMGATHTVAVMSSWVTQRGEAACLPKADRCEAALRCGADLVVELPLPWACATAETFAFGAVYILNALGCVDFLSFGSECGDTAALIRAARLVLRADGSKELAAALSTGVSFPRARELAISAIEPEADLTPLKTPNDTLAIEYIKALIKLGSAITPMAVLRRGAAHEGGSPSAGIASASHIRSLLESGRLEDAFNFVPGPAAEIYRRGFESGNAPFDAHTAEAMVLSQLRRLQSADFARLPDVGEGLENRIRAAVDASVSLEQLLSKIKTKRYTLSRIRRVVASAFLGLTRDYTQAPPPYIRVLGLNSRGAEILGAAGASAHLPVVTRRADILKLGPHAGRVYALECLTADLCGLCLPGRLPCGSEQKYQPLFFDG